MKRLEISLRHAASADIVMADLIRIFGYDDIEINRCSTNSYEFEEEEEDDEIESSIREALNESGIPEEEYWITEC